MMSESDFPKRLRALQKRLMLTQSGMAEKMGLSLSYVHQLGVGKRTPSDSVIALVTMLEDQLDAGLIEVGTDSGRPMVSRAKEIPLVGWAHAGDAASYEEIPADWQETITTDCRDEHAFAVKLEGDSMEDQFRGGDILIVMPTMEFYSGCFVVCRFLNDGIVFRRMESSGERINLVPLNPRYKVTEHDRSEFAWIYPVYGRWSQLWKR